MMVPGRKPLLRDPLRVATLLSLLGALLGPGAVSAPPPPKPLYTITDLGVLPTSPDDISPDLNHTGTVVGWTGEPDAPVRAVRWVHDRVLPIGVLPGYPNVYATGVNESDTVVGLAKSAEDARRSRAILWRQGKIRDLGTLGGRYATARAVNDRGQVVGSAETSPGVIHACLWQKGAADDLGTLGNGQYSVANAISQTGQVVGSAEVMPNGRTHAFLWAQGRMRDLGLLAGGSFSSARAVNAGGQVVGWGDDAEGEIHAVLWEKGNGRALQPLWGAPSSAWGINDHGQVVGASAIGPNRQRACLWTNGRARDINTLIPPKSGWTLQFAYRVNNQGWILGSGLLRSQTHLYLLTPLARTRRMSGLNFRRGRPSVASLRVCPRACAFYKAIGTAAKSLTSLRLEKRSES